MLILKFQDIICQNEQSTYQQFQYFKIILAKYSDRQFKIKKAYTKLSGRWQNDREIDYVQEDLDVLLVQKLVNTFNGEECILNSISELYNMYHILQFFQIQVLIDQVNTYLCKDNQNILIAYQLSEIYEIEILSLHCAQYFQEYGFQETFKKIDLQVARKYIYQNKRRLVPTHYFYLQPNLFKKLLCYHNILAKKQKQETNKFYDQYQIALIISEFCLINGQDLIKLKEILSDTVSKELTDSQKVFIMFQFCKASKNNQKATLSSVVYSEEDDLSDITNDYKELENKNSPLMEPIEVINGNELDIRLLIGLKNLQIQIKTKYSQFAFNISEKIEIGKQIYDSKLQLINLQSKQILKTCLKINWIKWEETQVNINNRLIIYGKKGVCRYEDDVQIPKGEIKLTGCRFFEILQVRVLSLTG